MVVATTTPTLPAVPTPAPIPSEFATLEAKVALYAAEVEAHLSAMPLAYLQKLESLVSAGGTLPNGLEAVRSDVVSFLTNAIAFAQGAITAAQMVAQLAAIQATPVAPPSSMPSPPPEPAS